MFNLRTTRFVWLCLALGTPFIVASCYAPSDVPRTGGEKADDPSMPAGKLEVVAEKHSDPVPAPKSRDPKLPSERLRVLAAQRTDYLLMVGVPLASPTKWATVTKIDDDSLVVTGHGTLPLSGVNAFIVAYPNGQLVDHNLVGLALPRGITGLSPSLDPEEDILQLSDLEVGKQFIRIDYGISPTYPNDRNRYSTTLTNLSKEKIRVQRFAGYWEGTHGWELATVTSKFYSAEDFASGTAFQTMAGFSRDNPPSISTITAAGRCFGRTTANPSQGNASSQVLFSNNAEWHPQM